MPPPLCPCCTGFWDYSEPRALGNQPVGQEPRLGNLLGGQVLTTHFIFFLNPLSHMSVLLIPVINAGAVWKGSCLLEPLVWKGHAAGEARLNPLSGSLKVPTPSASWDSRPSQGIAGIAGDLGTTSDPTGLWRDGRSGDWRWSILPSYDWAQHLSLTSQLGSLVREAPCGRAFLRVTFLSE